ncbi:hypothetical protein [Streptomyces thermodiastaticus]|uniref:hypothetical protein n=1 Tax=Streptomyces thermodiastaticus TaxID=44061 RepID=UPI00167B6682|nr:hypothetical protein [Streptomyces thermodiastaticus]MCE7552335.1 hypothetical protein [Streptomyces thermodiastaticus]GHF90324.1 hypothetical protein GCM10018787_43860 [Streptomyces thermodiastaticus]
MITSKNPVGDWTWELTLDEKEARPVKAVKTAAAIWSVLARHELSIPGGRARVSIQVTRGPRVERVEASGLPLEREPLSSGTALSSLADKVDALVGNEVFANVRFECPGYWLESGVKYRAEILFVVQVDLWPNRMFVVTIETYHDAWLTMDTRDREQPEIYAQNAPRLTAALKELAALFGSAPIPGDPNRHATPTEFGFEDPRIEGFAYDDSWGTFEVPGRAGLLERRIPASEDEYEGITDHPVRYFTIQRDGQTLGYLWASTGDEAAGYEPRTALGEVAFEAGAQWLLRLREAHAKGMSALAALSWAAQTSPPADAGLPAEDAPRESPSLDALQELSGRY